MSAIIICPECQAVDLYKTSALPNGDHGYLPMPNHRQADYVGQSVVFLVDYDGKFANCQGSERLCRMHPWNKLKPPTASQVRKLNL